MRNPADLKVVAEKYRHRKDRSFVGIRNSKFFLPRGFGNFDVFDGPSVVDLFSDLYKTFRAFRHLHEDGFGRGEAQGEKRGYQFEDKRGEQVTLYSKLASLEAVLDGYDEPKILRLISQPRVTEEIDYSKIHRYLHKAIYLQEQGHLAYIDQMVLPKKILTYEAADMVRLFCYIFAEVKAMLKETDLVLSEVQAEAYRFKEKYMQPDSSLFTDAHRPTIRLLKETFAHIDRQTGYKDADYWHFYDAVETFLYGTDASDEDGVQWGASSFAAVWEDLCHTWVAENQPSQAVYADSMRYGPTKSIGGYDVFVEGGDDFTVGGDPPFYIRYGDEKRFMRPDLVQHKRRTLTQEQFNEMIEMNWIGENVGRCEVILLKREGRQLFRSANHRLERLGRRLAGISKKDHKVYENVYRPRFEQLPEKIIREQKEHEGDDKSYRIVDFKFVPARVYRSDARKSATDKRESDVQKQLVYEYALQLNHKGITTGSQLCVPRYFRQWPDDVGEKVEEGSLHSSVHEGDITVLEVNFEKVLSTYLEVHDSSHQEGRTSINGASPTNGRIR